MNSARQQGGAGPPTRLALQMFRGPYWSVYEVVSDPPHS